MKRLFNQVKQRVLHIAEEKGFSELFYRVYFAAGILMFVVSGLVNVLLGFHWITYAIPFSGIVVALLSYLIAYKISKRSLGFMIITLYLNFCVTPFMWLTNLGFSGGFQYFVFILLFFNLLLLKGKTRNFIASLYILLVAGLGVFESQNPDVILAMSAADHSYPDQIISIIISMIGFMFCLNTFISLYQQEHEKIILLSTTDPLTKQYNRRFIQSVLNDLYTSPNPNSLKNKYAIFFDLDDFKDINDTKGHTEGDRVLVQVCQTIKKNIRETDYLSRIGGDEFLLIIEATTPASSREIAHRIIEQIQKDNNITISAGITALKGKKGVEELLITADKLMYASKKRGKNTLSF